jgi:hypothetical protein
VDCGAERTKSVRIRARPPSAASPTGRKIEWPPQSVAERTSLPMAQIEARSRMTASSS